MEHLTLKAATTQVTDQGVFEAVISTETADREQDVVSAEAMVTALKKWNRPVPLAWNHSTAAEDIIGSVEPMTAAVKDAEVVVQGQVDLDSDVGKQAWRSFKNRTIGFSFGYMTLSSSKREGGGRHLTEVDIFEVTATPTPMNNETRVLSTKGAEVEVDVESGTVTATISEAPAGGSVSIQTEDSAATTSQAAERFTTTVAGEPWPMPAERQHLADHRKVYDLVADEIPPEPPTPREPTLGEKALEMILPDELAGLVSGELKAVWSAAYVNDLPDSSFLYVESGGEKDEDGKTTPRSLRHFPVKGPDGMVDLPHLRNALARIPQSNLPKDVKDRLIKKAQAMLDNAKSAIEDVADEDPPGDKSQTQDPPPNHDEQRRLYQLATVGIGAPPPTKAIEPTEIPPVGELRRQFYDLMLETVNIGEDQT